MTRRRSLDMIGVIVCQPSVERPARRGVQKNKRGSVQKKGRAVLTHPAQNRRSATSFALHSGARAFQANVLPDEPEPDASRARSKDRRRLLERRARAEADRLGGVRIRVVEDVEEYPHLRHAPERLRFLD